MNTLKGHFVSPSGLQMNVEAESARELASLFILLSGFRNGKSTTIETEENHLDAPQRRKRRKKKTGSRKGERMNRWTQKDIGIIAETIFAAPEGTKRSTLGKMVYDAIRAKGDVTTRSRTSLDSVTYHLKRYLIKGTGRHHLSESMLTFLDKNGHKPKVEQNRLGWPETPQEA